MHWLFLRYVSSSSSLFITHTPIFNYSLVTSYFQQGNTLKPTTSFIEEYPWIHTRHDARSPMLDVRFLTEGMNRTNGLRTSMILWATSPTLTDSRLCDWYYELSVTTTSSCSPSFGLYSNLIARIEGWRTAMSLSYIHSIEHA